ncbi:hypothetical protein TKK_0006174 [Trichogramma kaykai]
MSGNVKKKPPSKFTWCGSCKQGSSNQISKNAATAAAGVVLTAKRTSSTSPLKKPNSTLQLTKEENNKNSNLSLAKYSPCASRLAASSKILSSETLNTGCCESPLHAQSKKASSGGLNDKVSSPTCNKLAEPDLTRPASRASTGSRSPQR